jgi:membrane fusion protein (multidrug efflux system)
MRQQRRMVLIVAALIIAAIVAGVVYWLNTSGYETTDDAFIDAHTVSISSQVNAAIADVPVTDNQLVEPGTVLVRLDDRDYRAQDNQAIAQVAQAKANMANIDAQVVAQQARIDQAEKQSAQAQAALAFAQQQETRYSGLVKNGAGTVEQAQQYASGLLQAEANYAAAQANAIATQKQLPVLQAQREVAKAQWEQARAAKEQADANLSRTLITAPEAGRVARLTAAKGNYAAVGQALMMFVPREVWITANFKETQLLTAAAPRSACCRPRMRPATSSRLSSACRSRSYSTSCPTCCSVPACPSCRPSIQNERPAAIFRPREPLGGRRSQPLAHRHRCFHCHFHGCARHCHC